MVVDTLGQGLAASILFLTKKSPDPIFLPHILDLIFFQGHKPTHAFKSKKVGADWLGK